MTGTQLRQIIAGTGHSQKELAQLMTSIKYEQDWSRIFRSDDVRTSVVEELARVTGMTMAQLYGEQQAEKPQTRGYESTAASCDPRLLDIIQARDRQIERLQLQIAKLTDMLGQKMADLQTVGSGSPVTVRSGSPAADASPSPATVGSGSPAATVAPSDDQSGNP